MDVNMLDKNVNSHYEHIISDDSKFFTRDELCPIRRASIEFRAKIDALVKENECPFISASTELFHASLHHLLLESKDIGKTIENLRLQIESVQSFYENHKDTFYKKNQDKLDES